MTPTSDPRDPRDPQGHVTPDPSDPTYDLGEVTGDPTPPMTYWQYYRRSVTPIAAAVAVTLLLCMMNRCDPGHDHLPINDPDPMTPTSVTPVTPGVMTPDPARDPSDPHVTPPDPGQVTL